MNHNELKNAIIKKDNNTISKIIGKNNLNIDDNIENIILLAISNKCNLIINKYINNIKLNNKTIYKLTSAAIEVENSLAFELLINNQKHTDNQIAQYVYYISMQENIDFLNILFSKYKSFNCMNLNCIKFCLNSGNYSILSVIVKYMNNCDKINEKWINENIETKKNKDHLKKIIKINKF